MSKIRVLPDHLANQIAAGEVVERPASIVKELLENAIDAGAIRLRVDIESGGRRLIRIADDGEGMMRDDAILAFERHATSKIKTADDLGSIVTLGFRGEALASIAAVSKVKLLTQTANDLVGTQVEIHGGKMLNVKDAAFARGSEFEIKSLFFNVPARLKFLKSEATESFHIANLITHYALANPRLAFTLTNNGRESISVTPVETLRERAYQLFGGDFVNALIEVYGESGETRVTGFVSSPSVTRTTKDSQYFFINGRYVRDKVLSRALTEAYRAMMPTGVYPSAMLFVELPPAEVDVNVHPAKTEVRFVRSAIVHDLIRDSVRAAIGGAKPVITHFSEPAHELVTPPPVPGPLPPVFRDEQAPPHDPHGKFDIAALVAKARAWTGLVGLDLAKDVTCAQGYRWNETRWAWPEGYGERTGPAFKVVAIDYGAKRNILRCLASVGCDVTVLPATATAEEVLAHKPDGVFLSNGPGDPAATGAYAVPMIQGVLARDLPLFGICLGHQMLALAAGAKTIKMHQGHRGANHPVKRLEDGVVEITSMNHGFAVDNTELPEGVEETHVSLFDGSNCGIAVKGKKAFSVQYHPEASPGPMDSFYLFERFVGGLG